jgi:hypothetical protein
MYTDMGMTLSDVPVKYFTKSVFPASKLTGQACASDTPWKTSPA